MPKASARRIKPAVAKTTYEAKVPVLFTPCFPLPCIPTHPPPRIRFSMVGCGSEKSLSCRRRGVCQVSVIFSPALAWLSARAHDLAPSPGR